MTIQTVRPNATPSAGSWTIVGGDATHHAAVDDAGPNDATLIRESNTHSKAVFDLGTYALAATERIKQIRMRYRAKINNIVPQPLLVYFRLSSVDGLSHQPLLSTVIQEFTEGWEANPPGQTDDWDQADLDALQIVFEDRKNNVDVSEVYVDVDVNTKPTVTATAPTGTITTTRPQTNFTYADTDGDAQSKFRVKIFSAAQYGAGGFDPETSAATHDSGEQAGAAASYICPIDLADGTYRSYVKVAHSMPAGGDYWSSWGNTEYTVTPNRPAVPTLARTVEDANARVRLDLAGFNNLLSENQADLEIDASGWEADANQAATYPLRSTAQADSSTGSLIMRSGAGGDMRVRTPIGVGGRRILTGRTYTARGRFRAATTGRSCRVLIRWYDAAGGLLSTSTGASVADVNTGFTLCSVTAAAPANAVWASVVGEVLATGAANEDHYLDRIGLFPGNSTTWYRGGGAAGDTGLSDESNKASFVVEFSDDGGGTWAELRGTPTDPDDGSAALNQEQTLYDYEARGGVQRSYRAYSTLTDTTGKVVSSVVSATVTATQTISQWWLKDPLDSTLNMNPRITQIPETRKENLAVHEPLGRVDPVVIADALHGFDGKLSINATDAAGRAAVEALMAVQNALLLQSPLDHRYIRVIGRGRDRYGAGGRRYSLDYVEVGAP